MTQTQTVTATFAASAPVRVVTLTASASFPVKASTAVTWTPRPRGDRPPLQYRFWRHDLTTGASMMVRDYAAGNTFA